MKKKDTMIVVSLTTIVLSAICGLILLFTGTSNATYIAGVVLLMLSVVLCPMLELLPVFRQRK